MGCCFVAFEVGLGLLFGFVLCCVLIEWLVCCLVY